MIVNTKQCNAYPHLYGAKQSETISDWQRHGHELPQLQTTALHSDPLLPRTMSDVQLPVLLSGNKYLH